MGAVTGGGPMVRDGGGACADRLTPRGRVAAGRAAERWYMIWRCWVMPC